MPRKTMIEAIRDAMDVMMGRDDNVIVFGEDAGFFGGVFRATQHLQVKYGKTRCFDTPISELGIVGAAVGMAAYGLRPALKSNLPTTCIPLTTSSFQRRRACAIARMASSRARWWCECQRAVEFLAARRTARARKLSSHTFAV